MAFKPFKPPSLKGLSVNLQHEKPYESSGSGKRRKLSPDNDAEPRNSYRNPQSSQPREPLKTLRNPPSPELNKGVSLTDRQHYTVLWRKFTAKKIKTWDDDGVACWSQNAVTVYDSKGHQLGAVPRTERPEIGIIFSVGGREVQIEDEISRDDFKIVINGHSKKVNKDCSDVDSTRVSEKSVEPSNHNLVGKTEIRQVVRLDAGKQVAKVAARPVSTSSSIGRIAFKQPLKDNNVLPQLPSETPIPRHDPNLPGTLVFRRPKRVPPGQQIVDVVLDPILGKHLRDHQREGIKFLYECVMDMRDFGGQGCILADDMGLGKTLQTIALLWTLIKQNPIHKAEAVVKKALIVCPVTLVENWKKEFRKWLGRDRLGVMTFGDKGSRLSMFDGKNFKVMILGYERLRSIAEDLTRGSGIDIIICDEGHRLKTLQNKSAKAIETLNTTKRIILSGTPIQNDLSEFFAMANFVNDGVLGSYKSFVKDFEKPIMKSRQPNATEEDIERGEDASSELAATTSPFILRRSADILSDYLPPRTEYVLFCKPTPEQANVYRQVLRTPMFQSALGSNEAALQMINILKKLCNSPSLLKPQQGSDEAAGCTSLQTLNEMLPAGISRYFQNSYSSKIRLLDELLYEIRTTTDDKVVLVSHYTSTLDLMENLLLGSGMTYRRLDGSVPHGKRQAMVDEFNRASPSVCFAFLLSAKAGGMGINLIGANRLVLFDVDWNPAIDDQAMARIHREGQRKPCNVYRFLIKGGLEERIWQRQVVKRGLADSVLDGGSAGPFDAAGKSKNSKAAFSGEELRDLFRLHEQSGLQTHDLIQCNCQGSCDIWEESSSTSDAGVVLDVHDDDCISESDYELPDTASLLKASALTDKDIIEQESKIAAGGHPKQANASKEAKQEMQELMRYTHIDTEKALSVRDSDDERGVANLGAVLKDDCLMRVLNRDKDVISGNIAYIFLKQSGLAYKSVGL